VQDITNWTAFLIAAASLIPAVIALMTFLGVRQVHKIVNSQRTEMMTEIDVLKSSVYKLHQQLAHKAGQLAVALGDNALKDELDKGL
jgi:hypothetical protein